MREKNPLVELGNAGTTWSAALVRSVEKSGAPDSEVTANLARAVTQLGLYERWEHTKPAGLVKLVRLKSHYAGTAIQIVQRGNELVKTI